MKKILVVALIIILCGCQMKEMTINDWPQYYPKYEGKGKIYEKDNKKTIQIKDVKEDEVKEYFNNVKKEYPSVIVENETIYHGVNKEQQVIAVEYNKEKNTLSISEK